MSLVALFFMVVVFLANNSLTQFIISTIHNASYKLTCGEIIKAIKQLHPEVNPSSIRRILTRLVRDPNYSITRTANRPYLYYYYKTPVKYQLPYELESFFDSDEPLFIHRILIMIRDVQITKNEKLDVPLLKLSHPIHFSFYKTTQSIRIDLKCSGWKRALGISQFHALLAVIDTVLHLKNNRCSHDAMQIVNLDLNQDKDFHRLAGANFVSVQAFENLLLTAYNKREGLRKEVQLSSMDIPVDRMISQLERNALELKIGTVFNKTNTVLNQFTLVHNQAISKLNSVLDYNRNVVQQLDTNFYNYSKDIIQIAQFQQQTAENSLLLVQQLDKQTNLILEHDSNIKNECDFLAEEIQILKVISTNQARSDSLQTRILKLLKEKDCTLQDLVISLNLDYNRIYYHIRKMLDLGKITAYKEERIGKGARKRIYKIKAGE